MGSVPSESEVLLAAKRLIDAGVAVHWLNRREKSPVAAKWQTAPVHTLESLTAAYQRGYNLGVRPGEHSKTPFGYLHLIDLDIRKPEQAADAWAVVLKLWPTARSAPFVISGSGGESRHLYFVTDKPFRSMTLGHSDAFEMVFDPKKGREVKKRDWEVSVFGAPKQAVLPPSVHPDTGENYVWGREIDWDLLEMGVGPVVSADQVESWGVREDDLTIDGDDDLMAMVRSAPMGLSEDEINRTIADLPADFLEDHDSWRDVGMALHHEYEGSQIGFEKWCEWARASAKFDLRDHKTRWKSFGSYRGAPVRMASLIQVAGRNRAEREMGDLEDLFGDLDEPETGFAPQNQALTVIPQPSDLDDLLGGDHSIAPGARRADNLEPLDPEWKSYLQLTEDGLSYKATLHNVELIVRNDPRTRGVMAYNEFTQEMVQVAKPKTYNLKKAGPKPIRQLDGPVWQIRDDVNGDLWLDSHDNGIRLMLEAPKRQGGYALKTSDRDLRGALDAVSNRHRFHPVREYLNDVKWDGVPRMDRLFIDYVGADDTAYHHEAARLFMLGAVTRVFEPGHKFDFVPILEGLQGKRKSTFVRILARHWFSELEGDFHDTKAMVEKMQGSWILEIPELQGFSKAEVTTIKGFISRTFDKVRLAYAKRASEFHRQCVFIGSTNDVEYLRDSTGGRRFWPIACNVSEIDTDGLARNVDQLWAEAKAKYDEMRLANPRGTLPLYLRSAEASEQAKALQESRRQEDSSEALAESIQNWLDRPIGSELGLDDEDEDPRYRNQICVREIFVDMLGREEHQLDNRKSQEIARALRLLKGWHYADRHPTKEYGRQRVFRRDGVPWTEFI